MNVFVFRGSFPEQESLDLVCPIVVMTENNFLQLQRSREIFYMLTSPYRISMLLKPCL